MLSSDMIVRCDNPMTERNRLMIQRQMTYGTKTVSSVLAISLFFASFSVLFSPSVFATDGGAGKDLVPPTQEEIGGNPQLPSLIPLSITAPSSVLEGGDFTVIVTNADDGSPVPEVTVYFDYISGYISEETNENGEALFAAPFVNSNTSCIINAFKVGCSVASQNIDVINVLVIEAPDSVTEGDSFSVTVKSDDLTVQGVTVTFDGTALDTDQNGQVQFVAPAVSSDTNYDINANEDGYLSRSKTILVYNQGFICQGPGCGMGGSNEELIIMDPPITLPETGADYNVNDQSFNDEPPAEPSGSTVFYIKPTNANQIYIKNITLTTTTPFFNVTAIVSTTNISLLLPDIPLENNKITFNTYTDITFIGDGKKLTKDDIESIIYTLKVEKNWFSQNNIGPASLQFMGYQDEPDHDLWQLPGLPNLPKMGLQWKSLTPELDDEDDQYYYYHVESLDYLGTFTIVGTQVVEVHPYQTDMPEIPWAFIVGIIIASTIVLVVVLFKAGYIYREEEQPILSALAAEKIKTEELDKTMRQQRPADGWNVVPVSTSSDISTLAHYSEFKMNK